MNFVAEKLKSLNDIWTFGVKYRAQVSLEKRSQKSSDRDHVLMFHEVKELESPGEFTITIAAFKELVNSLIDKGVQFCTPKEFCDNHGQKRNRNRVLLTFDDAYEGVYSLAFPFLKENHIPFIVFQSIAYLERASFLDRNMIKEMMEYDGFYLGAHTVNHVNLHESSWKKSYYEIVKSKTMLENVFGIYVAYFAYPYGSFVAIDGKDIIMVALHYKNAFCTLASGYTQHKLGRYMIPRLNVNNANCMEIIRRISWE
jgi:peptidoglycan/xylan/chitin deacetylase (PgdA/CDA1 family)